MIGAIRAEILKVFTTRLWWGLLIALIVIDAGLSALFGFLVGQDFGGAEGGENPFVHHTVGTAQIVYAAGFIYFLSPLVPLALGVLLITSEFRHKTISATFLSVPRRWQVIVAKLVAVVVVGAVYGVVHDLAASAGGGGVMAARGYDTFLGNSEVWKTFGLSLIAFICWVLIGYGFGVLIRNQIAATILAIAFGFIIQIALQIVFAVLNWDGAAKYLPSNLTLGMLVTNDPTAGAGGAESPYLNWWQSALVLTVYGLALSLAGSIITSRRDVA